MLLDSCFLIDLIADDERAVAKLREIGDRDLSISTLTFTEVGTGIRDDDRERQFEEIVEQVDIIPFGVEQARRATREQRRLLERGQPVGAVDAMIGATALEANKAVVTRNVSEFERLAVPVSPY